MIDFLKISIICATFFCFQVYAASIEEADRKLPSNTKPNNSSTNVGAHIVGGIAVTITKFPYQASLRSDGEHMCGASIIGSYWLLTAAHCTNDVDHDDLTVRIGSKDRTRGGTILDVAEVIEHDDYDSESYDYDIALLRVSKRISMMTTSIAKISLVAANTVIAANTNATVSGWGHTRAGASAMPTDLRAVSIPTVSQAKCEELLGEDEVTSRMLCAGALKGGKDSCQYDSGGPLVAVIKGTKVQIGVVSHGDGCGKPNKPGVYASIPNLRAWIKTNSGI